jgi:thioredoxin 1
MPILDTPITTDDQSLERVLAQDLPALLIFHHDDIDKALDDALRKIAKKHAGDLLVVRLHTATSQSAFIKYGEPATPALVSLTSDHKRKVKADATRIRPADVRAHTAHLLTDKPLPTGKKSTQADLARPIHVTDKSFREEVLKSKVPVLVDFWADWCGPCHQIAPHIEALAAEYSGTIKIAKLDVDHNQVMSRRYQVQSIPTMIIFEGGQPAQRIVGANPVAVRKAVERYAK